MPFLHKITEEERAVLIELNRGKLNSIRTQINDLQKEAMIVHGRIIELEMSGDNGTRMEAYSDLWSVAKKTEYCLTHHGAVLNTRQIAEKIDGFEGNNYSEDELKTMISGLSATLKQKVDKRVTFGRIHLYGDWYYGLAEWFNGDNLKDGYERKYTPVE